MDNLTKKFVAEIHATGQYDRKQIDIYVKQWQAEQNRNPKLKLPQFLVQRQFMTLEEARSLWNIHRLGKPPSQSHSKSGHDRSSTTPPPDKTLLMNSLLALTALLLISPVAIKFWPETKKTIDAQETQPKTVKKDTSNTSFKTIHEKIEKAIAKHRYEMARAAIDQLKKHSDFSKAQRETLRRLLVKINSLEAKAQNLIAQRKRVQDLIDQSEDKKARNLCLKVLAEDPNLAATQRKWFLEQQEQLSKRIEKRRKNLKEPQKKTPTVRKEEPEAHSRDDLRSLVLASLGPVKLPAPKAIEPNRQRYFPKKTWHSRVQATKKWLKRTRLEQQKLILKEAKQAIATSKKRPMTLDLTDSLRLEDVVIKEFNEERFVLACGSGDFGFRWSFANPEIAYQVRRLAVVRDSAESNYRFGRFCANMKKFGPARRAFAKAAKLRPEYQKRIPDLAVLEQAATIFHGTFRRLGGSLVSYDYDFSHKDQLKDFQFSWQRPLIKSGSLLIPNRRRDVSTIQIANVKFEHQVKIQLTSSSKNQAVFLIQLTSKQQGINVYYSRNTGMLRITDVQTQKLVTRAVRGPKGRHKLAVSYRNREIRVKIGGRRVAKLNAPKKLEAIMVRVGGFAKTSPFLCSRLRIEGKVRREWLTKTFKLADDAVAGLLADNGLGAPFSAWIRPLEKTLSAEDPVITRSVPLKAMRQLQRAREILANKDFKRAQDMQTQLFSAQKLAPGNPLIYYQLGTLERLNQRFKLAIVYLNRALELAGGFHEALAQRARILVLMERYEAAQKDLDRAFAIRPDAPLNFLVQAILYFYTKKHKKAKQLLELGVALTPRDPMLLLLLRNSTFVLKGPPWDRSYTVETEHYIVKSDISQKKTQFYADHLEWIHSYYKRLFPMHQSQNKAMALIFKTNEGYYQYSNLTVNDRVEWTAGVYRDLYNQLLLFEDPEGDLEETIETLYHEGFHQFMSKLIRKPPAWLNEGFADYFSPTRFNESGQVISSGGVNGSRLGLLQKFLRKGHREVPFEKMMTMPLSRFQRGNVALHYCQSWAMIHFFRHGSRNYAKLLDRYFQLLREGSSSEHAFRQTYGQLNLKQLQTHWKRFILRLK